MPPWIARATGASWYLAGSCLVTWLRGKHSAHAGCDITAKPAANNMACFTRMVPILFAALSRCVTPGRFAGSLTRAAPTSATEPGDLTLLAIRPDVEMPAD